MLGDRRQKHEKSSKNHQLIINKNKTIRRTPTLLHKSRGREREIAIDRIETVHKTKKAYLFYIEQKEKKEKF